MLTIITFNTTWQSLFLYKSKVTIFNLQVIKSNKTSYKYLGYLWYLVLHCVDRRAHFNECIIYLSRRSVCSKYEWIMQFYRCGSIIVEWKIYFLIPTHIFNAFPKLRIDGLRNVSQCTSTQHTLVGRQITVFHMRRLAALNTHSLLPHPIQINVTHFQWH